jgi:hypothetical protein
MATSSSQSVGIIPYPKNFQESLAFLERGPLNWGDYCFGITAYIRIGYGMVEVASALAIRYLKQNISKEEVNTLWMYQKHGWSNIGRGAVSTIHIFGMFILFAYDYVYRHQYDTEQTIQPKEIESSSKKKKADTTEQKTTKLPKDFFSPAYHLDPKKLPAIQNLPEILTEKVSWITSFFQSKAKEVAAEAAQPRDE